MESYHEKALTPREELYTYAIVSGEPTNSISKRVAGLELDFMNIFLQCAEQIKV